MLRAEAFSFFPPSVKRRLRFARPLSKGLPGGPWNGLASMVRLKKTELAAEERTLLEAWRDAFPHQSFAAGFKEDGGTVYVPTPGRERRIGAQWDQLAGSGDESIAGTAKSLRGAWSFREPHAPLAVAVGAYEAHLALEGAAGPHWASLSRSVAKSLDAGSAHLSSDVSESQALFVAWHADAFRQLTQSVLAAAPRRVHAGLQAAVQAAQAYAKRLRAPLNDGTFEQTFPLLQNGIRMDRQHGYPTLLSEQYAFPESAADVEAQGRKFLSNELPKFRRATQELAHAYDCEDNPRVVKREMARLRNGTKPASLDVTTQLREPLLAVVRQRLVGITSHYQTTVMETPSYLESTFPTAGASSFARFTDRPFNRYYLTTSERRAPAGGLAECFQTLFHEEIGHCVNASNSAARHGPRKPRLAELVPCPLEGPQGEAYSFNLEWMGLELLRDLFASPRRNKAEEELVRRIVPFGKPDQILLELEFETSLWRVIRYLRAVGDVRLNSHNEAPLSFLEWGERETGLGKKTVYDQVFTFQDTPGYAPGYAIAGARLRRLLDRAEAAGATRRDFNTYVSSMGFPSARVADRLIRAHFG